MTTCARCGGTGHTAPRCPWPLDERDLELPRRSAGVDLARNSLGPSSTPLHTGRNEREIALADRLGKG